MKNILCLSLLLSGILCHSFVFAAENIAIVDLEGALRASNYSLKQYKVLQTDENYKRLVSKIKQTRKSLDKLQKESETKSLTWSDGQKQAHLQKGQAMYAELNSLANQEVTIRSRLDASIQKELAPKVEVVVNQIIEEKKIGLLLKAQAVYFRTIEFDITEELVKRLNISN
jgi:Skp family chaperone for outer membrane proteins